MSDNTAELTYNQRLSAVLIRQRITEVCLLGGGKLMMSRTIKGNKSTGFDFWSKYKCNRNGVSGFGKTAKRLADRERRNNSKLLIKCGTDDYNLSRPGATVEGVSILKTNKGGAYLPSNYLKRRAFPAFITHGKSKV